MHQATQITDSVKSNDTPTGARGSVTSSFVINLCSSTSPVALAPPDHAGLKRFTFFVSRRREDGRERFRLHMGYFETQEEAEKLLDIVREIYPGAWAGMAPGQRLRAAAMAAAASPASTTNASASEPILAPAPAVEAVRSVPVVPVLQSDGAATAAAPAGTTAPAPKPATTATVVAAPAAVAAAVAAEIATPVEFSVDPPAKAAPRAEPIALESDESAARSLSDVRAAIASLDDSAVPRPSVLRIPELKAAAVAATAAAAPVATKSATDAVLTGAGAIALLETPVPSAAPSATPKGESSASRNEGTGPQGEKPVYAVQLMWSVQPIDMTQVPQLAIFSAYTLYGAEGNREGRRWYGLRLGFFTDAVSAKQVAHYVRSEFSTVSVVPVTPREHERARIAASRPGPGNVLAAAATAVAAAAASAVAGEAAAAASTMAAPKAAAPKPAFEFIDDKPVLVAATPAVAASEAGRLPPGPRTGRGAPGKRAKLRTKSEAATAAKPRKLTLEETLEILGAGDLAVDEGRGELINDESPAVPSKRAETKAKPSRLGRLFERLSERIGN
jgi:hypothetical protein